MADYPPCPSASLVAVVNLSPPIPSAIVFASAGFASDDDVNLIR